MQSELAVCFSHNELKLPDKLHRSLHLPEICHCHFNQPFMPRTFRFISLTVLLLTLPIESWLPLTWIIRPFGTNAARLSASAIAAPTIAQTVEIAPATGDRAAEATQLLEQGIQQYRASQVSEALRSLQQALTLFETLKDAPNQAKTLRSLGNVHYLLSDYDQAIAYYQQSLDLSRKTEYREGEAAALGNLGVAAAGQGNYRQAREYYQQALSLYQTLRDRQGEGQTLGNLAEIAYNGGDYSQAINYLQQALTIARELKDSQLESNTLGTLGVVYYSLSDYKKATDYHQQHLALARQVKDRRGEAVALNNLGNDYHALGNYSQAIVYQEQKLALARQLQDRLGEAQSLKNLSSVYSDLGNYREAIRYAFDSLSIARAIKHRVTEASVLSSLGNLYLTLQDYATALDYHQKRLAIAQEMNDPGSTAVALTNLGNVYKSMGQYESAITAHQQVLTIARQLGDRTSEATALVNLGISYDDLGQFAKAIDYHRQSLAIVRETKDHATEGLVLNNLGNALFHANNLAEAETTLLAGLQVLDALRAGLGSNDTNKVSIFDQQTRTYRLLQRVLVAQNKIEAALEIAERGRARPFVDLLSQRLIDAAQQGSLEPTQAITIAQIRQIAKTQNSTLVQYSITYEDQLINGKVEPRESELYIWAIVPGGQIHFRKVDLKPLWQTQKTSLNDLIFATRERMGLGGRGIGVVASADTRPTTRFQTQLHQLLIQPIADILPTDSEARVTFIPQGALFLVPFAALRDSVGTYLIQRHTLLIAPSIQVLALTHQQRQRLRTRSGKLSALVVGNPTMPKLTLEPGQAPEPLASLPGAEQEAKSVAPLLATEAVIGDRATKVAIVQQMPQQQIIHLATHGLLDDFKGLGIPGAIALAPSKNDNGLLTADEIQTLRLKAELVVLSACDTGRGRITGDGVIGLSRSFISAGVPSLVVSLWAVPDAPTATLMTEFYQTLKRNPNKAQALRQAMLTTLKQHPDPRDWAAFVLVGEAE